MGQAGPTTLRVGRERSQALGDLLRNLFCTLPNPARAGPRDALEKLRSALSHHLDVGSAIQLKSQR